MVTTMHLSDSALLDAWLEYGSTQDQLGQKKMKITSFKNRVGQLLSLPAIARGTGGIHVLVETTEREKAGNSQRVKRKPCSRCYANAFISGGGGLAARRAPKVKTYCSQCPGKAFVCKSCFDAVHEA